jgi:hypothetical protein
MKFLFSLILLLLVLIQVKAQKVKPALNLTKGNTYYMISSTNSDILQTFNGQDNKIKLALSFKMVFKVNDILDSLYSMEVSYQSLNMKICTANGDLEIDSKKNDSMDIQSEMVNAMMDKPFNITISKSGKVKSVENVEDLITNSINSFPQVDTAKRKKIKSQFIQFFGAKAFKENLELATAIFPEGYVRKNRKWILNTRLESNMTANLQTTYQLLDIEDDCYLIRGNGIIVTDDNAGATSINGLPVKYHLTGTMICDIEADRSTGWVTELNLNQTMTGDFEIQDNPKMPGGMTIPITINNGQTTTDK